MVAKRQSTNTETRYMTNKGGRKPGFKATKTEREAGARNLAMWKAENPEKAAAINIKHGATSKVVRQRYSDKRTTEGRRLHSILQSLSETYGPELTPAECLILDRMREKLIVLMQIGKYVDRRIDVLNEEGRLLPCLDRKVYLAYYESLRRDLEALNNLACRRPKRVPDLQRYLEETYGNKDK